jgi:hypothetical protein
MRQGKGTTPDQEPDEHHAPTTGCIVLRGRGYVAMYAVRMPPPW